MLPEHHQQQHYQEQQQQQASEPPDEERRAWFAAVERGDAAAMARLLERRPALVDALSARAARLACLVLRDDAY